MKGRPIAWPFGGRFVVVAADPEKHVVLIDAKRWPWSRVERIGLELEPGTGRWFWTDTHTALDLAPRHVIAALQHALVAS